jgi:hypothetical protein
MAIVKIILPNIVPETVEDYKAQNNLLIELIRNLYPKNIVIGSFITKGSLINISGSIYMVDNDTAITGTPSKYVKITPSSDGGTCLPSFVASLSGVSWDNVKNGYYDISGNLYIFNESRAVFDGQISQAYTLFGRQSYNNNVLYPSDTIENIITSKYFINYPLDDGYSTGTKKIIIEGSGIVRVKAASFIQNSVVNNYSIRIFKNTTKIIERSYDTVNISGSFWLGQNTTQMDIICNKNDTFYAQMKFTGPDPGFQYRGIPFLALCYGES